MEEKLKERLKANWGEKADALDCFAEVRFFDPLSSWCCYVYAMDQEEETICALLYTNAIGLENCSILLSDISSMHNEEGQSPMVDREFRRTRVSELIKRLRDDTRRD